MEREWRFLLCRKQSQRTYTNTWTQVGQDIHGLSAGDDFGKGAVDSRWHALGQPFTQHDSKGGYASVYQEFGGSWTQVGSQSLVILVILCLLFHFQLMASVWQLVSPALEKPVLVLFVYLAKVRRTPGPR